jgi:hypothetical protein
MTAIGRQEKKFSREKNLNPLSSTIFIMRIYFVWVEPQLDATTPATESTDYNLPKRKSDFQRLFDYDKHPHGFQNMKSGKLPHSWVSERRKFA